MGQPGFNEAARRFLAAEWRSPSTGSIVLLPQQEVVAKLMHPKSPVERLLADHNTGSGKTLAMIRVLDNFFDDPRPKVCCFPKDSVVSNFYLSLWEWPSRWRDYLCSSDPALAAIAADSGDWASRRQERWSIDLLNKSIKRYMGQHRGKSLTKCLKELFVKPARDTLEMKHAFFKGQIRWYLLELQLHKGVDLPASPLRAYRFTSAGGVAADMDEHSGLPRGCIFKIGYEPPEKNGTYNPYHGKVVIMDEAHHLTRPHPRFERQLQKLKTYVAGARRLALLAVTGSMVEDNTEDPRALLDAIKGDRATGGAAGDEGLLSSHHVRGAAFPR